MFDDQQQSKSSQASVQKDAKIPVPPTTDALPAKDTVGADSPKSPAQTLKEPASAPVNSQPEDIFADTDTNKDSNTGPKTISPTPSPQQTPPEPTGAKPSDKVSESRPGLSITRDLTQESPFKPIDDDMPQNVDSDDRVDNISPAAPPLSLDGGSLRFGGRRIVMIVLAVIVVGGLGFGGWWIWRLNRNESPEVIPTEADRVVSEPENRELTNENTTPESGSLLPDEQSDLPKDESDVSPVPDTVFPDLPSDKDADGLPDAEEELLGTNPLSSDTDGDGLYDREEVKVWNTDPTNSDTDGDGYQDGDEVREGYNPNGEGKLKVIPR